MGSKIQYDLVSMCGYANIMCMSYTDQDKMLWHKIVQIHLFQELLSGKRNANTRLGPTALPVSALI